MQVCGWPKTARGARLTLAQAFAAHEAQGSIQAPVVGIAEGKEAKWIDPRSLLVLWPQKFHQPADWTVGRVEPDFGDGDFAAQNSRKLGQASGEGKSVQDRRDQVAADIESNRLLIGDPHPG